ncbi:conserved hypothetical protein [Neospora caninum Liverpool]|uniref:Uncharacterized protein n=1 Tax=Neospora caninum (strain Liverpool) TaxID=572307 RepID=F0VF46_NEOCL|nr:conserved hypothetical protein [Neospora caninum Liverpool]CBZ52340.1 conserved hypothetical protein [Neospora caninum Liverpool]|eukprot:XP_003882372.1 conserved hypothetical protein [Neospora caninum Liverpool]
MRNLMLLTAWLALHATISFFLLHPSMLTAIIGFVCLHYGDMVVSAASERTALHRPQLSSRQEHDHTGLTGMTDQERACLTRARIIAKIQIPFLHVSHPGQETHVSPEITAQLLELWDLEKDNGTSFKDFLKRARNFLQASSSQALPSHASLPRQSHSRETEKMARVTPDAEWMDWSTKEPSKAWSRQPPPFISERLYHEKVTPCSAGHRLTIETSAGMTTHVTPWSGGSSEHFHFVRKKRSSRKSLTSFADPPVLRRALPTSMTMSKATWATRWGLTTSITFTTSTTRMRRCMQPTPKHKRPVAETERFE